MIKNLLFDLGGVIMDIEKNNCIEAFRRLGMRNPGQYFGDFSQQGPFARLEAGEISPDEFHRALAPSLPPDVTADDIDRAFMRFLIGIPLRRLADLRRLRARGYRLYMLSNTNPIMWDRKIKDDFTAEGLAREDYFDGIVTSFAAKAMKPDRAIFDYACRSFGINPAETLFIDDSQANLDAAAALGFHTVLAAPGTEFIDVLNPVLNR